MLSRSLAHPVLVRANPAALPSCLVQPQSQTGSQAQVSSPPPAGHQCLVWAKCINYPKAMSFSPASPLTAALLVSSISRTVGRGGVGSFSRHKFASSFPLVPQPKNWSSVVQCLTFAIRLGESWPPTETTVSSASPRAFFYVTVPWPHRTKDMKVHSAAAT